MKTRLTCSKMVKMLKMFKDAQSFRSASKNITSNGRQTASTVVLCGKTTIKKFSSLRRRADARNVCLETLYGG